MTEVAKPFKPVVAKETDEDLYQKNPHIRQWRETGLPIQRTVKYNRHPTSEATVYKWEDEDRERSVSHWGQLKLLLSEIEFLSLYSDPDDVIVYIGGAPGVHISLLASLFTDLKFILFDPAEFDARLYNYDNIEIRQQLFTSIDSLKYRGANVLLISDIRSADTDLEERSIIEEKIIQDMRLQESIYELLQPKKALLKFRLPYPHVPTIARFGGKFNYLDGEVFIQAYARKRSSETRLVPNGKKKDWDLFEYQNAMYDYNFRRRVAIYSHPKIEGLDDCYDCYTMYYILKKYLDIYKSDENPKTIEEIAKQIYGGLAGGRFNPLTRPVNIGERKLQHD
jgi:hypothetical protein